MSHAPLRRFKTEIEALAYIQGWKCCKTPLRFTTHEKSAVADFSSDCDEKCAKLDFRIFIEDGEYEVNVD